MSMTPGVRIEHVHLGSQISFNSLLFSEFSETFNELSVMSIPISFSRLLRKIGSVLQSFTWSNSFHYN